MNQYEVLKKVHKVGHPISGIVAGCEVHKLAGGWIACNLEMQTDSAFKSILPYDNLSDNHDFASFDASLIPAIGTRVEMVVENYVDGTLYLSAKPSDVAPERIADFVAFYEIVEKIGEGAVVSGRVVKTAPFGLFVELPSYPLGLIDIGFAAAEGYELLPYDASLWPQTGDAITCKVIGFRFHDRQIALSWLPDDSDAGKHN